MKFELYIHPEEYQDKQKVSADSGHINNRITQFKREVTLPQLAEELAKGKTVLPALMKDGKRNKQNFESIQIFMVDIDNAKDKQKLDGGYLPLESALLIPFVRENAVFYYKSLSYQPDWEKYRLVFVLDQPATTHEEVSRVYQYLLAQFGECADRAIKTAERIFFGGFDATEINFDNRIKLADIPQAKKKPSTALPQTQQATQYNSLDEEVKAYIEKDKENLLDEANYTNVLYSLVKDVRDNRLNLIDAEKYITWIALENADWEVNNVKRLHEELKRGTQPNTNWGFIDKVRYVVGKPKEHPIKQILSTLKQYSYQDFLEAKKEQKKNAGDIVGEINEHLAKDGNGVLYNVKRTYPDGKEVKEYKLNTGYQNKKRMWGLQYEFFFNLFNHTIEIFDFKQGKLRDYEDNDDHLNYDYVESLYHHEIPSKYWRTLIINLSHHRPYNPVKMRVEEVQWDSVPRAERYFIDLVGCEDSLYTREVTKVWFTGLIARIYEPGVKFEIVPILAGKQGIGKSTACRRLFPDYFTDELKSFGDNKDDYQKLENVAIVELGEMKGVKKAEIADIKSFISTTHDVFRRPFERYVARVPRHCVFIGTSNPDDFLKDDTGERRFYPLKVGVIEPKIHPMQAKEAYFLQVLAEAKTWYDNGAPLTLSPATIKESLEIQEEFKAEDPMKDAILNYIEMKVPTEWEEMTLQERQVYYRQYYGLPTDSQNVFSYSVNYTPEEQTEDVTKTSINEIAFVVFGEEPVKHRGGYSTHGKIRSVLDNLEGWGKSPHKIRLTKGSSPVHGYVRK